MKLMQYTRAWLLIGMLSLLVTGCQNKKTADASQKEQPLPSPSQSVEETPVESSSPQVEDNQTEAITETLPIGTIVKVKGNTQKLMIMVHNYQAANLPNVTFQYGAYVYPQGNVSSEAAMAFDNEDIEEVVYKGLESQDQMLAVVDEVQEGYLPMGSVVKLGGLDTPVMIFGRHQTASDGTTIYDYAACPYPEGNTDPSQSYLFNKDAIESIGFIGYSDEDETNFINSLGK